MGGNNAIHPVRDVWYDPMSENLPDPTTEMSRKEKESIFAITFIGDRLKEMRIDANYELKKVVIFVLSFVSSLFGMFLILFGLGQTVLFSSYPPNFIMVGIGGSLCLPLIGWFLYIFCPSKVEHEKRKEMHRVRKERQSPNLLTAIVEEAQEFSRPPVQRMRLTARLRKRNFVITAATLREFCELVEKETGLLMRQQILKYKGELLPVRLDDSLIDGYKFDNGEVIEIFNRGGFEAHLERKRELDKGSLVHADRVVPDLVPRQKKTGLTVSISKEKQEELHRSVPASSEAIENPAVGASKILPRQKSHNLKKLMNKFTQDPQSSNMQSSEALVDIERY